MKRLTAVLVALMVICIPISAIGMDDGIWQIIDNEGVTLTEICHEPTPGDEYLSADNILYEITEVTGQRAYVASKGKIALPDVGWLDWDSAYPAMAMTKRIAMYCTHSDESYLPTDGYYSTTERGSIYQVGQALSDALTDKGVEVTLADTLHHPHDAGAYRRSRQTAVQLLKTGLPDCLIDIHRDGIPDPDSYAVTIGGEERSKIRLLVGRGNQNAAVNKEFALMIKAVADHVYPGLIKDIYMGKGTFNQDLLPRSILLECGTYTLEKERVIRSMPLMADVLNRALYGGIVGSAGRTTSDVSAPKATGGVTMGEPDTPHTESRSIVSGIGFLAVLLLIGVIGFAILSAGSFRRGMHKAQRNIHEMTGGIIGKEPERDENPHHS